jgi:hypothetical protein
MPEKQTIERAREDAREGKSASTQAGEFVRGEMRHIRRGKHGAKNTKQAIAIGLSKARRSGVKLPPSGSKATQKKAKSDLAAGERQRGRPSAKRSRAGRKATQGGQGRRAASSEALSRQAKQAAGGRSAADRSRAARKAAATRKDRGTQRGGARKRR